MSGDLLPNGDELVPAGMWCTAHESSDDACAEATDGRDCVLVPTYWIRSSAEKPLPSRHGRARDPAPHPGGGPS